MESTKQQQSCLEAVSADPSRRGVINKSDGKQRDRKEFANNGCLESENAQQWGISKDRLAEGLEGFYVRVWLSCAKQKNRSESI